MQCGNRLGGAGRSARQWTIHRGEIQLTVILGENLFQLYWRHADSDDLSWQRVALQAAAVIRHLHRLLERQGARDVRRRHLAGAVADDGIRRDAPRFPHGAERNLHGKVGDLCKIRLGDARRVFVARQFIEQAPRRVWLQCFVTALEHVAEDSILGAQLLAHAPPLWTHPGEDIRNPSGGLGAASHCKGRARFASNGSVQGIDGFVACGRNDGQTIVVVRAPVRSGAREVCNIRRVRFGE